MPRLPEFDRAEVLDAAMNQFMAEGYEASSISKLLGVMRINRGSLYGAFGDKETLFREVMNAYVASFDEVIAATLAHYENPIRAIEEFFNTVFLGDEAPELNALELNKGCLLFNTVSELAHSNPPLAVEASNHIQLLQRLFQQRLQDAKDKGLVSPDMDVEAQADTLLATTAGLRLMCKMDVSKDQRRRIIETMLCHLK